MEDFRVHVQFTKLLHFINAQEPKHKFVNHPSIIQHIHTDHTINQNLQDYFGVTN